MKKTIFTLALITGIALNLFAQREIPMFFDKEMRLVTGLFNSGLYTTYSPDGSKVALAFSNNKKIAIWEATSGKELIRLAGHDENISGLVFSPNGRQLVTFAEYDSVIKIWDAITGMLIRSIPQSGISAIAYSPDGSRIAGSGFGNNVKIWNTANGNEIQSLLGHTETVWSVNYSPDGKQIVTTSNDRTIKIWDAGNSHIIRSINKEIRFMNAVYSPNGQQIATYINDRRKNTYAIQIFKVANWQEIKFIPGQDIPNFIMAYSPDSRSLLINEEDSNENNIIKVFNPDTGRELRNFNNGNYAISFSPDGKKILTSSTLFKLKIGDKDYGASFATIIDATTGKTIGTIGYGPLNVGAKAFSDLQIARFLNNTAEVSKNEAILKFITDKGYATRAEIEAFYRDNIRELVTNAVDEGMQKTTSVSSAIKSEFKQAIINFYVSPSQTTFRTLNQFLIVKANEAERQIRDRASKSTNAFVKSAVDFDIQMEKLDLKMLVMYVELQLPGIIKLVESP